MTVEHMLPLLIYLEILSEKKHNMNAKMVMMTLQYNYIYLL